MAADTPKMLAIARQRRRARLTSATMLSLLLAASLAPPAGAAAGGTTAGGGARAGKTGPVAPATDGKLPNAETEAADHDTISVKPRTATALFAGGCFWCMEPPFDAVEGVVDVTSGYTGGHVENPTYEQVSAGGTGHAEAVRVTYDPTRVGYERLLEVFWHNIDPLTRNAQFCDHGDQYRSAIFYSDDNQRRLAEASKAALATSGRFDSPLVTEIVPASAFYPAEEYHQDYYRKNPIRYRFYRFNCGRDARLKELWGDLAGEPAHASE